MPKVEIAAVKRNGGLFPVDEISREEFGRIRDGAEALITARTPRNVRQHRLAWALAQKLADSCDFLLDREDAMDYLKLRARHVRWVTNTVTGETFPRYLSISFASLPQEAFDRLFSRFVWIICHEILPGLDEADLSREVLDMVDGDLGRRLRAAA